MPGPILLDAYAAQSCAVKTQHKFDPRMTLVPGPIDDHLQELFDLGEQYEADVATALLALVPGTVDLRGLPSHQDRVVALRAAAEAGAPVVLGATLPRDAAGHRLGQVDILVRGADRVGGGAGYLPVEVKNHRVRERRRPDAESPAARLAPLSDPSRWVEAPEARFRFGTREGDLLQLAHYWRLLEAAGLAAADGAWGGVVGNDPGEPVVTWVRLDEPVSRTFSRTAEEGWTRRSILTRYDHEFAFRLQVAEVAVQQAEPEAPTLLVHPIRIDECRRCPWWELCRQQLGEDDLSLRLDKGPLDVREISVLRRLGIRTVADLATVDLAGLLPEYLAEVTHRDTAESRIRTAHHRSVLMATGTVLERISDGPIPVTGDGSGVEIDFDLEASVDQRIYLWGFLVNDADGSRYVPFVAWQDLDEMTELELAERALAWLRDMVDRGASVHHYSGYEISQLERLAASGAAEAAAMLDLVPDRFVDLYEVVKQHWFGVHGLGLKQVATAGAGFHWRDDDPSGLSSQAWFHDAVHGATTAVRDEARHRLLAYNEDDVVATREVRRWLREQQ